MESKLYYRKPNKHNSYGVSYPKHNMILFECLYSGGEFEAGKKYVLTGEANLKREAFLPNGEYVGTWYRGSRAIMQFIKRLDEMDMFEALYV